MGELELCRGKISFQGLRVGGSTSTGKHSLAGVSGHSFVMFSSVKIVHFIKCRPLQSRPFATLCHEMGSDREALLLQRKCIRAFWSSAASVDLQHDNMADWSRGHGAVDEMLDAENKLLAENLASKVSRLKSLAYDIDKEADEQNMYLDGMDSNFLSATGLLTGSVKRFSTMLRSSRDNRKIMCYMSGGLVALFFLLYYLVSRLQR
ncbi:unnamed protein product [Merluccius merluccius]